MTEVKIDLPEPMQREFEAITEQEVRDTDLALPEFYSPGAVFVGEAPEIVRKLFAFHRLKTLVAQDATRELYARQVAYVGMCAADVLLRRIIPVLFQNIQSEGTLLPARGWKLYCVPMGQDPFGKVAGSKPN